MDTRWLYVGFAFIAIGLLLRWFWSRISPSPDSLTPSSSPDPTATLGNVIAVIGVLINVVTLIFNVVDSRSSSPTTTVAASSRGLATTSEPEATTKPTTTTKAIAKERYPGFRPLPPDSPKRESGYPHMETVCQDLGRAADAWVPGQIGPSTIEGRKLNGTGQAYKWTCGGPFSSTNPKITRDQISQTCHAHGWGQAAYTWNPHYAYSWYCL